MADHVENEKLEFQVTLCPRSTSPDIQVGIWDGQHICAIDDPNFDEKQKKYPLTEQCGEAIIKHQLRLEHFNALNQAFVKFNCYGFPHSVITQAQIIQHRNSHFLVSSAQHTGQKFLDVSMGKLECDRAFYIRPPGSYDDQFGRNINWTDDDKRRELENASAACDRYTHYVAQRNMPMDMAKQFLPYCYRQSFVFAATVEELFHWVDQASKINSGREIRLLASLIMEEFGKVAPELHGWYITTRWSRARLAP